MLAVLGRAQQRLFESLLRGKQAFLELCVTALL